MKLRSGTDRALRAPALPAQPSGGGLGRGAEPPSQETGGGFGRGVAPRGLKASPGLCDGLGALTVRFERGLCPRHLGGASEGAAEAPSESDIRPVARTARAPDSKSGGWGFESLLACHSGKGTLGLAGRAVWAAGGLRAAALPPQPSGEVRRGLSRPLREESLLACHRSEPFDGRSLSSVSAGGPRGDREESESAHPWNR